MMKKKIQDSIQEAIQVISNLYSEEVFTFVEQVANMIVNVYETDHKILIAGNGGSLCDADHFAEELTGYFREERKGLAAISLSHPGHMSCVANDRGFEKIFSRGVESLGRRNDLLVVLTTSGSSKNLIEAVKVAKEKGLKTIAFLGKNGGALKGMADLEWIVPHLSYSDRIQEAHMTIIHVIIEMVEHVLAENIQKSLV